MLNAIYKNETNVIFSLKLNDEAAHGKFLGLVESGQPSASNWAVNESPKWSKWTVGEGPEVWTSLKGGCQKREIWTVFCT